MTIHQFDSYRNGLFVGRKTRTKVAGIAIFFKELFEAIYVPNIIGGVAKNPARINGVPKNSPPGQHAQVGIARKKLHGAELQRRGTSLRWPATSTLLFRRACRRGWFRLA